MGFGYMKLLLSKCSRVYGNYTLAGYIEICPYVRTFVRTCPNGVTTLQTSFLNQLSRNFTQVFTNIISCMSSRFDCLRTKTRSKSNLTDFWCHHSTDLSDCHEASHVFTNIISCTSSRFDLLRSKTRSKSNLTDFLYHSTDFIFYPIIGKLHTRIHKHHLL